MKKVEFVCLTRVRTTPKKLRKALTAKFCTVAIGCLIAIQAFTASSAATVELKRENNFDREWRFLKSDAPGAENAAFNDSAWRTLDLPHDWSLEDLSQTATNGSPAALRQRWDQRTRPQMAVAAAGDARIFRSSARSLRKAPAVARRVTRWAALAGIANISCSINKLSASALPSGSTVSIWIRMCGSTAIFSAIIPTATPHLLTTSRSI